MDDIELITEEESVESCADNDISILNYSQAPVIYQGVPKIWLTHPDSTEENRILVPFTYGEAVSKTVEPDFSGGDMEVPIQEGELVTGLTIKQPADLVPANIPEGAYIAGVGPGTLNVMPESEEITVDLSMADGDQVVEPSADDIRLSKVTIRKPGTLTPENIAEGVDIAGIIGALVAGGSDVKIATGTITKQYGTVTHNLGVVPDIVLMFVDSTKTISTPNYTAAAMIGFSSAFVAANPGLPGCLTVFLSASAVQTKLNSSTINSGGEIYSATKTSFGFGSSGAYDYKFPKSTSIRWIAIGGLT